MIRPKQLHAVSATIHSSHKASEDQNVRSCSSSSVEPCSALIELYVDAIKTLGIQRFGNVHSSFFPPSTNLAQKHGDTVNSLHSGATTIPYDAIARSVFGVFNLFNRIQSELRSGLFQKLNQLELQ
ncbi:Hypothetical_protein [Hexamita inflata]|uniref:Hypothetical_protein n=1 Tax=Hexamita inflata TaxID=28002 RepID=A0AA86QJD2_9EUKA|nr:Hypothetical protein HINF_LOCUS43193 [Hexamita inflata]